MKRAYLYCDKRSLNDATDYYINIIKECLCLCGYDFYVVHKIKDIKSPDVIFTITGQYFLFAKLNYLFTKTIYWAQGVAVEEFKMHGIDSVKGYVKYAFKYIAERWAVLKSDILFVVSNKMLEYYREKYGYDADKQNYIIMPCFNLSVSHNFNLSQYENPFFVYAGSASVWQCVNQMLEVYSMIEKEIEGSKLIILSSDQEEFMKRIHSYDIKNFEIKYVPYQELNDELHKYKYGFLLREDHIVNNVATPTKMNSYLSNYVIPIYSDAVNDFVRNINIGEFSIMAQCPLKSDAICDLICAFENTEHNFTQFQYYVNNIFDKHYNKEVYISNIYSKFTLLNW